MHKNTAQFHKEKLSTRQKVTKQITIESWNVISRHRLSKQKESNLLLNPLLFDIFVKRNKDFKSFESLIQYGNASD